MAVTPDLNQIATVMSQLQHNYSQLAQNWFDIFYNPTPKDVSITFYDELGNLETYSPIPNRAKDFSNILSGSGSPETSVIGNVGAIYQDLTNGEVYLKKTGTGNIGWIKVIDETELSSIIKKGGVDPEGSITGSIGDLYVDSATGKLYIKTTNTGNTGWFNIGVTKISDLTDDTATNPVDKADTLTDLTATVTELNYCDGVTSNIQTQLNSKVGSLNELNITATASELNVLDGITATTAELNYTDGVTSNIQTQLDSKADLSLSNSTSPVATAPYIKTTYVSGSSGYNIWSNGYCEQWGSGNFTSGNYLSQGRTLTLLKTYNSTNSYNVTGVMGSGAYFATAMFVIQKTGANSIYCQYYDTSGVSVSGRGDYQYNWKTSGYLAEGEY